MKPRLFLIDATAFCYRAFYAIKGLSTSFGQPTNAVYGFINMLNKILKEKKPEYLAVCFDVSRETFRAKRFADYKIQRPPMPDSLSSQIPLIKEIVSAYGITMLEKVGYEADDIIATLAAKAKSKGFNVTIVSSDKDILQLVDEDVTVFSPHKEAGATYDSKAVLERFGVTPEKIPDIIALMGDDVDNVPGVKGIGEKTAVELIKAYGGLDELLRALDKIKQDKLRNLLKDNIESIKLSNELALLDKKADIDFELEGLKIKKPQLKELFRLFKYLEFRKLLNELPVEEEFKEKEAETKAPMLKDRDLDAQKIGEVFLYGQAPSDMAFYAEGKFFRMDDFGENIKNILSDPQVRKISHDLKRIKVALARQAIVLEGLYFDTMLAAYLLNPSKGAYELRDIALEYSGTGPLPAISDNKNAIGLILQLKPKLEQELADKSLLRLFYDIEMPLAEVLAEMELNGIKVDLQLLKELSKDLEKRLAGLVDTIYDISGTQFNINSPKQLRQVLFEKLKLPVIKRTKTGPSTDEEVLKKLANSHNLPAMLLEYRQLTKLKTTYVDTLPGLADPKTGKVHTSFNQASTETGRLSSSNPNLQNLPIKTDIGSKIRQAILPSDKESCILACDYSQIELRLLAHICKDENLIEAFKEGKDIHKATAALIYGLKEEDVTIEMRETAKRVNFGIIYGLSPYGLSRDLDIPVDEAKIFIDAYFLRYPGVKKYVDGQIRLAQRDGFVTTILGRRRYVPEINNKNQAIRQLAERQAINTPIQGSASDLIKLAMIKIHEQIKRRGLKGRMLLQVHDELVFDVPDKEVDEFSVLVKDNMENVLTLSVPIKVSVKKGKNWLQTGEME